MQENQNQFSYQKYLDDLTRLTPRGHVDSSQQQAMPQSAGSRGLKRTTDFTKEPTQMKMGHEDGNTPIAESMVEIRSILDRLDGVSEIKKMPKGTGTMQGVKEETVSEDIDEAKSGITDANYKLLMMDISSIKDRIAELNIDDDSKTRALTALGDVEDELNFDESYEPFPEGDEFDIEEDEDFEEVLGPLGFPEDETELFDAEYQGRKVPLNKPMRGDVKKFKVYVKDPKSGNVKKVNFGHGGTSAKRKTMRIRKSNPKARKSFRARHNCANPGPKTKARYWSCRKW